MTQRMVDSVSLTLVSRLAMVSAPVVLAIGGWIITNYLSAQNEAMELMSGRVEAIETTAFGPLSERISVLENSVNFSAGANVRFQDLTTDRLETIQDNLVVLSTSVATISATLATIMPI